LTSTGLRTFSDIHPAPAHRNEMPPDRAARRQEPALQARLTFDAAFKAPRSAGFGLNAPLIAALNATKSRLESIMRAS
jgi:hypothetical protein